MLSEDEVRIVHGFKNSNLLKGLLFVYAIINDTYAEDNKKI